MPIPKFENTGLLPKGVHDCSITDIENRFTWNPHRRTLFNKFLSFLNSELKPDFPDPVYFDGSFVTDKEKPDDTDIVLDLTAAPDERKLKALIYMTQNQKRIKSQYGVHFWINLPGVNSNDFCAFFQYTGNKTASMKGISPRHKKGILRIR